MLKLGVPLDTDTVPDMVLVDMEVMVSALPAMEVTVLDTVSGRDPLMPIPKLGEPLDMDTVPDMVLVDMEVTVLVLPAMEVTALDMVSGRDLLMPIPKLGEPLDTDTVPVMVLVLPAMEVTALDTVSGRDPLMLMPGTDVATVDTEDTDTVDIVTESNFYISNNVLPFILISSHYTF